jgi:hypothetical protein
VGPEGEGNAGMDDANKSTELVGFYRRVAGDTPCGVWRSTTSSAWGRRVVGGVVALANSGCWRCARFTRLQIFRLGHDTFLVGTTIA